MSKVHLCDRWRVFLGQGLAGLMAACWKPRAEGYLMSLILTSMSTGHHVAFSARRGVVTTTRETDLDLATTNVSPRQAFPR